MEVEIHVSEKELAEFPEEATDSTAEQSQSGKTSQTPNQGTVQSLLNLLNPQEDQDHPVSTSDHIK